MGPVAADAGQVAAFSRKRLVYCNLLSTLGFASGKWNRPVQNHIMEDYEAEGKGVFGFLDLMLLLESGLSHQPHLLLQVPWLHRHLGQPGLQTSSLEVRNWKILQGREHFSS